MKSPPETITEAEGLVPILWSQLRRIGLGHPLGSDPLRTYSP